MGRVEGIRQAVAVMIVGLIAVLLSIQVWVVLNGLLLPRLRANPGDTQKVPLDKPLVSVLIPMRNEARNVKGCIASCKGLCYEALQFVIIDDASDDGTKELLMQEIDGDPRFLVIDGIPLPHGWVGKVHACHQLSQHGQGEFLLFLDADVRVSPSLIHEALAQMEPNVGLLSGFPHFPLKSVLAYLIVPLQHVIILMHLPLVLANYTKWPQASAAHGAFMFFRRQAYREIGGHAAVQSSLVEDVHITRAMKTGGWRTKLANVTESVSCLMYDTSAAVWAGFAKNIFPGLGRSPLLVVLLSLFYAICFVTPLPLAVYGLFQAELRFIVPLLLTWTIKFSIDLMTGQKWWLGFFMPLSMLLLIVLMHYSMYLGFCQRGFTWKGRTYQ